MGTGGAAGRATQSPTTRASSGATDVAREGSVPRAWLSEHAALLAPQLVLENDLQHPDDATSGCFECGITGETEGVTLTFCDGTFPAGWGPQHTCRRAVGCASQ